MAQRTTTTTHTSYPVIHDENLIGDYDICEGWAIHFESLAIPSHSSDFDDEILERHRKHT